MSEATAFVPTLFEAFASEPRIVPVCDCLEPPAEAGTDVFVEPAAVFVDKTELPEAVRTFVCDTEAISPRRVLFAVSNETARGAHQTRFMHERRCEKSVCFCRFFTANPPPLSRQYPCKTDTNAHYF